jgi:hypothetical protein
MEHNNQCIGKSKTLRACITYLKKWPTSSMENEHQLQNNYCGDLLTIFKILLFNVLVTEHYVERLLIICYFWEYYWFKICSFVLLASFCGGLSCGKVHMHSHSVDYWRKLQKNGSWKKLFSFLKEWKMITIYFKINTAPLFFEDVLHVKSGSK